MAYWLGDTCKNCGERIQTLITKSGGDLTKRSWTHINGEWRCPSPGVATPTRMG
jgi:hypothetical protein